MTDSDVGLKILKTGVATYIKDNRVYTIVQGNLSLCDFMQKLETIKKQL